MPHGHQQTRTDYEDAAKILRGIKTRVARLEERNRGGSASVQLSRVVSDTAVCSDDVSFPDYSLAFDGTDDYVVVPDSSSLDITTAFSLNAFVKTTDTAGRVIWKQDGSNSGYRLKIENGTVEFGVYAGANGNGYTELNSTKTVDDGAVHHIGGTWDGSNMVVYVDGESDGTATQSDLATNNLDLEFGAANQKNADFLDGVIDKPEIHGTALTAAQMKTASRGVHVDNSLISRWLFNEGPGATTVTDVVGTNDGTIHGATWTEPVGWELPFTFGGSRWGFDEFGKTQ